MMKLVLVWLASAGIGAGLAILLRLTNTMGLVVAFFAAFFSSMFMLAVLS